MNENVNKHQEDMAKSAGDLGSLQAEMQAMRDQINGLSSGADGMREMVEKQMQGLRAEVGNISEATRGIQEKVGRKKKN